MSSLGFIPEHSKPADPSLNTNSDNINLVKAVILGGFWPRVARVHLPKSAIKFDRVQAGTIQRENTAKEFKMYDLKEGRVFVHPASVLFNATAWKSPFLTYFHKQMTSKVFLRDATEVRLVFPLRGYVWSFSSRCLLGPDLRIAAVRRAGHGQPYRRRADRWRQGLFDQAQGLAAYWCSSKSPPVGSSLAPSHTVVRLTMEFAAASWMCSFPSALRERYRVSAPMITLCCRRCRRC